MIFICVWIGIGNPEVWMFTFAWASKTQYSQLCQFGLIKSKGNIWGLNNYYCSRSLRPLQASTKGPKGQDFWLEFEDWNPSERIGMSLWNRQSRQPFAVRASNRLRSEGFSRLKGLLAFLAFETDLVAAFRPPGKMQWRSDVEWENMRHFYIRKRFFNLHKNCFLKPPLLNPAFYLLKKIPLQKKIFRECRWGL